MKKLIYKRNGIIILYRGYEYDDGGALCFRYTVKNNREKDITVFMFEEKVNGEILCGKFITDIKAGKSRSDFSLFSCKHQPCRFKHLSFRILIGEAPLCSIIDSTEPIIITRHTVFSNCV